MVIIWFMMVNNVLVGGLPTPLKNDGVKVSWEYEIPNMWKKKSKCSKPPTSYSMKLDDLGVALF